MSIVLRATTSEPAPELSEQLDGGITTAVFAPHLSEREWQSLGYQPGALARFVADGKNLGEQPTAGSPNGNTQTIGFSNCAVQIMHINPTSDSYVLMRYDNKGDASNPPVERATGLSEFAALNRLCAIAQEQGTDPSNIMTFHAAAVVPFTRMMAVVAPGYRAAPTLPKKPTASATGCTLKIILTGDSHEPPHQLAGRIRRKRCSP